MKHIFETCILAGFVLFIAGGSCFVGLQLLGLVLGNTSLVVRAGSWFAWIYPLAAATGLLCYLISYKKK